LHLIDVFPREYDVQFDVPFPFWPETPRPIYYPGCRDEGGYGPVMRIEPHGGSAWTASFDGGYDSPPAISCALSWPDPRQLCVVWLGQWSVVRTDDPKRWFEIAVYPILDVRVVPELNLILFSDFTDIVAYGVNGEAWNCCGICKDDLRIVEVSDGTLRGTGFCMPKADCTGFEIDLRTGALTYI
jgi:hypothetical protein